ncbi:MAG: cob(I)yrinic acid a,c-diamide adenosyltransferase [Bacillota bacterium]|nr:MAG: cob(I)yrinic acid a,c-diamide adenosyltransferase [Bacillota bacterium]
MTSPSLLMVLTGNGKGKTTSAFGQALRVAGHGKRVLIVQFMKGSETYGELLAVRKHLGDLITVEQYGRHQFVDKADPARVDIDLAREGLKRARQALASGDFALVVLDELNVALDFKLVEWNEVEEALRSRSSSTDVLVTGRYAPRELVQAADLVSEILDIKHHYSQGVQAREGVEF